jgi:8-oxo-dGTP pyrophosphatase MutT (NUDIX family)
MRMAISDYILQLREKVGTTLLLMPSATALVFDDRQRLLLVQYASRDMWGLPGGALDPGETPADCVVRETWEETGLYVQPRRITGVYGGDNFRVRYENGDVVEYVMTVFECAVVSGTLRPDGEETLAVRFFELGELKDVVLAPWLRVVLEDVLERRDAACFIPPTWKPTGS